MSRGYFVEGVVLGAVTGLVAGLLLAPSSGEETREKLKKFRGENEDLFQETKERTEELIQKTVDAIERGFSRVSDSMVKSSTKRGKS